MKLGKLAEKYCVQSGKDFRLKDCDPADTAHLHSKKHAEKLLQEGIAKTAEMQDRLYAQDKWALLSHFPGDGCCRERWGDRTRNVRRQSAGLPGVFVQGAVELELQHDFLWRTACNLPERGHIGIFNRSYYEEVLVVLYTRRS